MAAGKRDDLEIVIGADLGGLAADLNKGVQLAKKFSRDVEMVMPKTENIRLAIDVRGLREAARDARVASSSFRAAKEDLASFAAKALATAGSLVALEAGFTGLSSAVEFVKDTVKMAADAEQTAIAFESMLGSAKEATETITDLRKFAAETPFSSKEVVAGARQLLAYGTAADQLIPTLKLLGSVASISKTDLGENIYRYGTTKVQGTAHQIDLNQQTNAGIDIYPGIAKYLKIERAEIQKYAEENRVDFNAYQAGLVDYVSKRGFGILEKQAKSLKGAFEQLGDAWDLAKLKLGQVIVKESGLWQVTKDLEAYAKSIERVFDSDAFKRGVKFTADLVKGTAHLGYELARMSAIQAPIWIEAIGRAYPGIQRTASAFHDFVVDAQDFKFDERKLTESALNFAEEFIIGIDRIGWQIDKSIIKPIEKALERWAFLKAASEAGAGSTATIIGGKANELLRNLFPEDERIIKPLTARSTDAEILAEHKRLRNNMVAMDQLARSATSTIVAPFRKQAAEKQAKEAAKAYQDFLHQFKLGPNQLNRDLEESLNKGIVPPRVENPQFPAPPAANQLVVPETLDQKEFNARAQAIRDAIAPFRKQLMEGIRNREIESMRAGWQKLKDAYDVQVAPGYAVSDRFGLGAALGPFGGLSPALFPSKGDNPLRPDDIIPQRLITLANQLNEQFLPAKGLDLRLADLDKLRELNQIDPYVYDRARSQTIRETAERMGLGDQPHLADAVLLGSQEDARLLSRFAAGQQQATTEDLLKRILDVLTGIKLSGDVMKNGVPEVNLSLW